jgi:hypothetical protein
MHKKRDGNHDGDAGAVGGGTDCKGNIAAGDPHAEQTYYRGNLANDREHDTALNRHALSLYRRAQRGEIYLLQRRIAVNEFDYFYRARA